MSLFAKRFLTTVFLLVTVFHFLMVFLYSSPIKISNNKAKVISFGYVYPFFHQSWQLFVPTPKNNYQLYVRASDGKTWDKWIDLFKVQLNKREKNPYLGNETNVLLFSSEMNYLRGTFGEVDTLLAKDPNHGNFIVLNHSVKYYLINNRCRKKTKQYEILFVTKSPEKTYSYYFKNLSIQ